MQIGAAKPGDRIATFTRDMNEVPIWLNERTGDHIELVTLGVWCGRLHFIVPATASPGEMVAAAEVALARHDDPDRFALRLRIFHRRTIAMGQPA